MKTALIITLLGMILIVALSVYAHGGGPDDSEYDHGMMDFDEMEEMHDFMMFGFDSDDVKEQNSVFGDCMGGLW